MQPATMAATARAAEARDTRVAHCPPAEPRPFLSGWRAVADGLVLVGVPSLLVAPALVATGSVIDAGAMGRAAPGYWPRGRWSPRWRS